MIEALKQQNDSEKHETIIIGPDEDGPFVFTDAALVAAKEIREQMQPDGDGLRIAVRGGGCAGMQYALDFTDARDGDIVMELDGLRVYCDAISAMHLEGTTVDYLTTLTESGFKFMNEQATTTCGCGKSFAT